MRFIELMEDIKQPDMFFHVTREENIPAIMKQGLVPQIGDLSTILGERIKAVYLFPSMSETENALGNWLGQEYEDIEEKTGEEISLAILGIKLPDYITPHPTFSDDDHSFEWTVTEIIPPQFITVLKTGE